MIDRLMNRRWAVTLFIAAVAFAATGNTAFAQAPASAPGKVIIDTDIGDDIDDVYALSLALSSPEFQILGITSAWGDTALRSRLLDRLLCVTGREEIPVYTGIDTTSRHKAGASAFSQAPWASAGKQRPYIAGDAIPFLLDQIRRNPGEVTLIAIGPLTNIGAAIDRDPATFRKLKRVVLMGGSVAHGYGPSNGASGPPPEPEYNIAMDPDAAQKLFQSGVPIVMLPLDSTQIKFEDAKRSSLTRCKSLLRSGRARPA